MRLICVLGALGIAGTAAATHGMPQQVTGAWVDPESREVIVRIEGMEFPTIRRLALGGERPRRFETVGVLADWSDVHLEEGELLELEAMEGSPVSIETRVRALGRLPEGTHRAFDVRVRLEGRGGSRVVRVRTFRSPDVRVVRVLDVPDEPYAIALIEYLGLDFEGGYTVEEPVLLRWP